MILFICTASITCYVGVPWVVILPIIIRVYGRRIPFIIVSVNAFIGSLVFYFSETVIHIITSEVIQGVVAAAYLTLTIVIITEYASPKYRGVFLTMKLASYYWGVWMANAIGTFFHWKYIALCGIVCSIYNIITLAAWTESPYWLASRGFKERCIKSHRWLKGTSAEEEKELSRLIRYETIDPEIKDHWWEAVKRMKEKKFYKPMVICLTLMLINVFAGKTVCTVYPLVIFMKITSSKSMAYTGMLILDGVTVISVYLTCFLTKVMRRRAMILIFTSFSNCILFAMSFHLYLIKKGILPENNTLSIFLLSIFSLAVSCGPAIMTGVLFGEIVPVKNRSLYLGTVGILHKIVSGTLLKLAPASFEKFGLHGAFLFFGLTTSVLLIVIYKYMPETKGKSLLEIDDCFQEVKKTEQTNKTDNITDETTEELLK